VRRGGGRRRFLKAAALIPTLATLIGPARRLLAASPALALQLQGFKKPRGVGVDAQGNIYVADTENHLIKKYNPAGGYLRAWGGFGSSFGSLRYPRDVAVGPDGRVFVADTLNDRIQVFDQEGVLLAVYSNGRGGGAEQFDTPKAVTVDGEGRLYVADTFNNRVKVLDVSGTHLFAFGQAGRGVGGLRNPGGVAVSPDGGIYVADTFHDQIQAFNRAGGFVRKWGFTGGAAGQFVSPRGMAVDASGRVYVSDSDNHRIQVFTPEGGYLDGWGRRGFRFNEFQNPKGIAIGPAGRLHVADQLNNTLPVFAAMSPAAIAPDPDLAAGSSVGPVAVTAALHVPETAHNIVDLRIDREDGPADAGFLNYYNLTGGLARWGYPLSEVFEETPGNFAQYYQRGAVDWHRRDDLGIHAIERRLGWDLIGGGRGGAPDQGIEAGTLNPNEGMASGPWGHKVSNQAVDGTETGFLDFFQWLGGEMSLGVAKTDARPDTGAPGTVMLPGATPGFIRQYFQAGVLEFHPDAAERAQVALIGYHLRALAYPGEAWEGRVEFAGTAVLEAGAALAAR
jgi:DNA-binding beta-propeller fold protein YncE